MELSNLGRSAPDGRALAATLLRAARAAAARGLACLRRALPQTCGLCAAPCGDALICGDCLRALPRSLAACPVCAAPATDGAVCGACLARPPPFAAAVAAFIYRYPVDRLVHAFKYGGHLALAAPLAEALHGAVRNARGPCPELIVALPLSASRQRERGFNQAREIARWIARRAGVPLVDGLTRVRDALPQAGLPRDVRVRNLRGAFAGSAVLAGRRVAIVDDVMTTGATLAAAARAARAAGAQDVAAWVVARTLPPWEGVDA
jgi:ComF family protein